MKKALSIFLLIVYSYLQLQHVLPYFDYAINYDYIVNELCENKNKTELACNGKCYLSKEIKQNTEDTSQHSEVIKDFKTQFHLSAPPIVLDDANADSNIEQIYKDYTPELISRLGRLETPPPRSLS